MIGPSRTLVRERVKGRTTVGPVSPDCSVGIVFSVRLANHNA